jgi:hypothetical protein
MNNFIAEIQGGYVVFLFFIDNGIGSQASFRPATPVKQIRLTSETIISTNHDEDYLQIFGFQFSKTQIHQHGYFCKQRRVPRLQLLERVICQEASASI